MNFPSLWRVQKGQEINHENDEPNLYWLPKLGKMTIETAFVDPSMAVALIRWDFSHIRIKSGANDTRELRSQIKLAIEIISISMQNNSG